MGGSRIAAALHAMERKRNAGQDGRAEPEARRVFLMRRHLYY